MYVFKPFPEIVRAVGLALLVYVAMVLSGLSAASLTDWRTWLIGVAVGAAHVIGTALLGALTTGPTSGHAA